MDPKPQREPPPFDAAALAAALAEAPGADAPGFLARAAACHLMITVTGAEFIGFNPEAVWPGRLTDFISQLPREHHLALAHALAARAARA